MPKERRWAAAERSDRDTSNSNEQWNLTSRVRVNLPDSVRDNVRMLRRLQHRLVDIMADGGFAKWLADDAEVRLEVLSSHIVFEYVIELLGEAYSPARKPKKTKKSKKTAK